MSFQKLLCIFMLLSFEPLTESFTTHSSISGLQSHTFGSATSSTIMNGSRANSGSSKNVHSFALSMSDLKNDGVVELVDDDETKEKTTSTNDEASLAAPFLSQGDIQKEALELSNDPKQTRVIIYIVLSLLPVLFLVPLMLGSRDLIPLDALPPVPLN